MVSLQRKWHWLNLLVFGLVMGLLGLSGCGGVSGGDNAGPGSGMQVTPTAATFSENGGSQSFNVVLEKAPSGNVVVHASSSDTTEANVAPEFLTFTPAN